MQRLAAAFTLTGRVASVRLVRGQGHWSRWISLLFEQIPHTQWEFPLSALDDRKFTNR